MALDLSCSLLGLSFEIDVKTKLAKSPSYPFFFCCFNMITQSYFYSKADLIKTDGMQGIRVCFQPSRV